MSSDNTNLNLGSGGDVIRTIDDGTGVKTQVVKLQQLVEVSTSNNSTTNLAGAGVFTGAGESTLSVGAIQVMFYADQPCTIQVDQNDTDVWTTSQFITDSFTFRIGQSPLGFTVQAVSAFFRIRVTNNGSSTTTYLNLQSVLCPVIEALPRALDSGSGGLKTHIYGNKDFAGFSGFNTQGGDQRVAQTTRLIGAQFSGSALDTNFWTATVANSATVAQAGLEVTLTSGTNTAGSAKLATVRRARNIAGIVNAFKGSIQLGDTGIASNTRKWGLGFGASMPTLTDGAYFKLSGTTFSVCTLKASAETVVASGSFNGGVSGTTGGAFALTTNNAAYEIHYTLAAVVFMINGVVIHTVFAATTTWTNVADLHCYADNINSGNTTSVTLKSRLMVVVRFGQETSSPQYGRVTGNAATFVFKLSSGTIHKLIFNNTTGTDLTIYDNTAGSGNVLAIITTATAALGPWDVDIPFFTGLCIVTTGNGLDMTVVYE